jgi:GAF domain-containing protein
VSETFNLRLLDLLAASGRDLVSQLEADACAISRAIGDVLIMITEHAPGGQSLQMGGGYLVSDYPLTMEVLATGEARALTLEDADADPQEAEVLRELGFASLVLMPIELYGAPWGLVEVYREQPRPFSGDEIRLAREIVARAASRVV